MRPRAVMAAAFLVACALVAAAGRSAHAAGAATAGAPVAPVVQVGGVPCVGADDLARLLDGVQYWRAETRRLVIRAQGHSLTFTDGAPIVLLDDRTLRLEAPVRSLGGELQVPVALLAQLPHDSASVHLLLEANGTRVRVAPAAGYVGPPRIAEGADETRVTLVAGRAAQARVVSRDREHFRLWLPGAPAGGSPDSLAAGGRVRGVRRLPAGEGVTWEFALAPQVTGWSLATAPSQDALALVFGSGAGLERFSASGPSGPRSLRVVVIDPGHGGDDTGVTVPGVAEKDLTLQLARLLAAELEHRAGARVVLTRDSDRPLAQPERAEIANRARADLVVSLHFDGAALTTAHGATAWCPPVADTDPDAEGQLLVPWRDVAGRWSGSSRALADAVAGGLEARGLGPSRVRERTPVALLGVNAPGIALECATLTSAPDLVRVTAPEGLRDLAQAIADGIVAWARHD